MESVCSSERKDLLIESFSALAKKGSLQMCKKEATPLYLSSSPFTVVERAMNSLKLNCVDFGVFSIKDLADDIPSRIFNDIVDGPGLSIKQYENLKYTHVNNSVFIKTSEMLDCGDFLGEAKTEDPNGVTLNSFFHDILPNKSTTPDLNGLAEIFDCFCNDEVKDIPLLDNLESVSSTHPFHRLFANANPIQFVEPPTVGINVPTCTVSSFGCVTPTQTPVNGLYFWDILLPLSKPKFWLILHSSSKNDASDEGVASKFNANLQQTIKQVLKEEHDDGRNRIDPTKFPDSCEYPLRSKCFVFSPEYLSGNHSKDIKMSVFLQRPGEAVLVGPNVYYCTASTGKAISFQLHQLGYAENENKSVLTYTPCPKQSQPLLSSDCGHSQQNFFIIADKQLNSAFKRYKTLVASQFAAKTAMLFGKGTLDLETAVKAVKLRMTVFVPIPLKKSNSGGVMWTSSPGVAYKMSEGKVKVLIVNTDNLLEKDKKTFKYNPLFVFITQMECESFVHRLNNTPDFVGKTFSIDFDSDDCDDDGARDDTKKETVRKSSIKAFPFRCYPVAKTLVKPFVRKKSVPSTLAPCSSSTCSVDEPEVITLDEDGDDTNVSTVAVIQPSQSASISSKQTQQKKRKRESSTATSSALDSSIVNPPPPPPTVVALDLTSGMRSSQSNTSTASITDPPVKRARKSKTKLAEPEASSSTATPATVKPMQSPLKTDLEAAQRALINAKEFIGIGLAAVARLMDDGDNKEQDKRGEQAT